MQIDGLMDRRWLISVVVLGAALSASIAAGISSASARPAGRAFASAAPTVPQTVTASLIRRRPGTLKPGTSVRSRNLGQRVFVNASHGFALASVGEAQYPAATVDGGKTWRTDGPALHINAAQAPLSVVDIGAANARTVFAFGGGQVVDATGDGGKHWWQAFLGQGVIAAVPRLGGGIIAVAQNPIGNGSSAQSLIYVSKDGGHHWHLDTSFGT
jgi:hypothetical protein